MPTQKKHPKTVGTQNSSGSLTLTIIKSMFAHPYLGIVEQGVETGTFGFVASLPCLTSLGKAILVKAGESTWLATSMTEQEKAGNHR